VLDVPRIAGHTSHMTTPTTPAALTLATIAEAFNAPIWEGKRVYVNGLGAQVWLALDVDGDAIVSIKGQLSGKKWQSIFDRVERTIEGLGGSLYNA
jgi:hypothetical protein